MKCTKQKNVAVSKIGLQFLYKINKIKNMLINENKLINKTPLKFKSQLSVVNGIELITLVVIGTDCTGSSTTIRSRQRRPYYRF
jgi:hypothetical protein